MHFETEHIYHIFNQGNNRQKVFFTKENYLFFLRKINFHIKSFADILAWCLMPNHFHLMVFVRQTTLPLSAESLPTSLSKSIGTMLSSYTRAVNRLYNQSGSLFRQKTKALCLTRIDRVTKAWYVSNGITVVNTCLPESQYPNLCFNYILFNPVNAGLVKANEEWEFCSFPDITGKRNGKLISREKIEKLGLKIKTYSSDELEVV